jgi:hypothetical protein
MIFTMPVSPGTDPTPWYSVQAPQLEFNGTPAAEALCRLCEQAVPGSVWQLAGYRESRMFSFSPRPGDEALAVVGAGQAWLREIDRGNYAASWRESGAAFRTAITEEGWTSALQATRSPLGEARTRRLHSAVPATKLPGAPDGRHLVMTFTSSFSAKTEAVETLTFSHEPDGVWRASGYFIK